MISCLKNDGDLILFWIFVLLEISQSYEKELDEFDRVKEQQDHVMAELVPKMNKDATKLIEVYSMTDLIESDVLDSLKDDAINVLKANPDDLPWVHTICNKILNYFM